MDISNTLVTVKKSDGTTVRMSLDEVKKMKMRHGNGSVSTKNDNHGATASVTAPTQPVIPKDTTVEVGEPKIMLKVEDNTETKKATSSLTKDDKVKDNYSAVSFDGKSSSQSVKTSNASLAKKYVQQQTKQKINSGFEEKNKISPHPIPSKPTPLAQNSAIEPRHPEKSELPVSQRHSERSGESRDSVKLSGESFDSFSRNTPKSAQDDIDSSPTKKIIKESGVNIPTDLSSRAISLVSSRLKGVRDDEQFMSYALKSGGAGGLGLNQSQAEKILKFVKIYLEKNTVKIVKPSVALRTKQLANRTNGILRKNTAGYQLANTTPVTDIFLDEAKAVMKNSLTAKPGQIQNSPPRASQPLPTNFNPAPKLPARIFQKSGGLIQDISEEKNETAEKFTGPVDEMKSFTLKDWRRLSRKPEDCAEIIFHKFTGWKEESFILYMDCRLAFARSFLMNEYRNILVQSINKNIHVQEIFKNSSNKESLTYEEFLAIGRLNAKLEV